MPQLSPPPRRFASPSEPAPCCPHHAHESRCRTNTRPMPSSPPPSCCGRPACACPPSPAVPPKRRPGRGPLPNPPPPPTHLVLCDLSMRRLCRLRVHATTPEGHHPHSPEKHATWMPHARTPGRPRGTGREDEQGHIGLSRSFSFKVGVAPARGTWSVEERGGWAACFFCCCGCFFRAKKEMVARSNAA